MFHQDNNYFSSKCRKKAGLPIFLVLNGYKIIVIIFEFWSTCVDLLIYVWYKLSEQKIVCIHKEKIEIEFAKFI